MGAAPERREGSRRGDLIYGIRGEVVFDGIMYLHARFIQSCAVQFVRSRVMLGILRVVFIAVVAHVRSDLHRSIAWVLAGYMAAAAKKG